MANDEMPEEKCGTCNAGPNDPCAYPTENAKRLREEVERLRAMVEGMKKDLAYIRVTETDVRLALDALPRWCWTMSPTKADIHAVAHRLTTRINSRALLSTTPTDTGEAE